MEILVVNGGKSLKGKAVVPAAKNAVLPIAAAAFMLDGESTIHSCPRLADVKTAAEITETLGCDAVFEEETLNILYKHCGITQIPPQLCSRMRSAVLYLAPLLYRRGRAEISMPGGCNLGARPVDIHLEGIKQLGAKVEQTRDKIAVTAPQGLKGTQIKLRLPSVGATQTLIMAACVAKGLTVLKNCAREPEVCDLAHFLNCAGAKITGAGKNEIIIQGVSQLNAVSYTPIPDRITAATILSGINACGGICLLSNYPAQYMADFEKLLRKTGMCLVHYSDKLLAFKFKDTPADINIHTGYYPAFPTDMGPLLSSAMVNSKGRLSMQETVFENRFSYKTEFEKLGMCCTINGREYIQKNTGTVTDSSLYAKDLRAGAAIVVAALAKRGQFNICGVEYIDRGYENIENLFSALGGRIRRIQLE